MNLPIADLRASLPKTILPDNAAEKSDRLLPIGHAANA